MNAEQQNITAQIASAQLAAIIQQQGAKVEAADMDRQAHMALQYTRFLLNHLAALNRERSS